MKKLPRYKISKSASARIEGLQKDIFDIPNRILDAVERDLLKQILELQIGQIVQGELLSWIVKQLS